MLSIAERSPSVAAVRIRLERRRCAVCEDVETVSSLVDSHECMRCGSEIRRIRHAACGTTVAVTITSATAKERAWDYQCTCGDVVRVNRTPHRGPRPQTAGASITSALLGALGITRDEAPEPAAAREVPANAAKRTPWQSTGSINTRTAAVLGRADLPNGATAHHR